MDTRPTAMLVHPAARRHDPGRGHPEHGGRIDALVRALDAAPAKLRARLDRTLPAAEVDRAVLERVHSSAHVTRVERACHAAGESGSIVAFDGETAVSTASWDAIVGGLGLALAAARSVCDGVHRNAFVATRPPGHHATPDQAMGFCSINSIAVLARALQAEGRAERVLIVDWDVHHGNGTQDAFYEDPSVFFLSLHQWPAYPGTGAAGERGAGAGEGTTLNLPLPPGTDRALYLAALEEGVSRTMEAFDPDIVLVSAGFDTLAGDPLGGFGLEPGDLRAVATRVRAVAEARCEGRIVALLEGGYDPERTAAAVLEVLHAFVDPVPSEGPPRAEG